MKGHPMCLMVCYGRREIWVQDFRRGTERHLEDLSVNDARLISVRNGMERRRLHVFFQVSACGGGGNRVYCCIDCREIVDMWATVSLSRQIALSICLFTAEFTAVQMSRYTSDLL
jgi:hypothetical protein